MEPNDYVMGQINLSSGNSGPSLSSSNIWADPKLIETKQMIYRDRLTHFISILMSRDDVTPFAVNGAKKLVELADEVIVAIENKVQNKFGGK